MNDTRRIRIVSDGTVTGTKIYDKESGGKCLPAFEIDWHSDMEEFPSATVKVVFTEVDIETDARIVTFCPACRREVDQSGSPIEVTLIGDECRSWVKPRQVSEADDLRKTEDIQHLCRSDAGGNIAGGLITLVLLATIAAVGFRLFL